MTTLSNWRLVGKDGTQDVYANVVAESITQAVELVTKECWGFKLTQSTILGPACVPQVTSLRKA